jgi:hypothetical protein
MDPGNGDLLEAMTKMRGSKLTSIILFLLIIICGSGEAANRSQKKEWLSYQPTVVKLKGTLRIKQYYGPPNFGENPETDAKEELPVLDLISPVNVRANPNPMAEFDRTSVEELLEIQLILKKPHKQFINKTVYVTGTLFHAFTGHHHTDVLMDVRSIRLAH